jgi:hypothetical protein
MMWFARCVMWFAGSIGPVWCGVHLGRMFVEWTLLNPCSIYSTNIPPHQHNATQGHRFCYMQAARRISFSARVLQHITAWGREGSAGQRAASLASQHTACTAPRSHAQCTMHHAPCTIHSSLFPRVTWAAEARQLATCADTSCTAGQADSILAGLGSAHMQWRCPTVPEYCPRCCPAAATCWSHCRSRSPQGGAGPAGRSTAGDAGQWLVINQLLYFEGGGRLQAHTLVWAHSMCVVLVPVGMLTGWGPTGRGAA